MGSLRDSWYLLSRTIVAAAACSLFHTYGLQAEQASGPSMEPTLPATGSLLLTWKGGRWLRQSRWLGSCIGEYKRGMVVLLKSPESGTLVCKRIVGVPGDTLYVLRGERPNDSSDYPLVYNVETVNVPPGHIWVQGDNQPNSHDSRHYGCISQGLIYSTVLLCLWPPTLSLARPSASGETL